jgi:hypothetical protein
MVVPSPMHHLLPALIINLELHIPRHTKLGLSPIVELRKLP